jgi:hypothetical protein
MDTAAAPTPKQTIRQERVVAERDGNGWLVMWPTGDVEWFGSKRAVRAAAGRRIGRADILISEIEFRG